MVIILLPWCSLSRHSPSSLCDACLRMPSWGAWSPRLGDPSAPQGKVSLPGRHSPVWLTIPLQRYSQAACMMCYLPVPWRGACLPGDIAVGFERQGEKAQKPKRSKKDLSKCRVSSMHSLCTPFCRGFWSHQPGAGVVLHLRHLHAAPCCCFHCCQCLTPRPYNEMSMSPLISPSNLGSRAEPSPMVLHQGKGAFEQEKQWRALPETPQQH